MKNIGRSKFAIQLLPGLLLVLVVPYIAPAEQIALTHMPGGTEVVELSKEQNLDGGRSRQANRDIRLARAQEFVSRQGRVRSTPKAPWVAEDKTQSNKGKGKGKTKDQAGMPLCFSFASGTCACGSVGPGSACQQKIKRAHKCQFCLSPGHRNSECPKQALWIVGKVKPCRLQPVEVLGGCEKGGAEGPLSVVVAAALSLGRAGSVIGWKYII